MKKIIWLSLFLGSITWISCSHYEQLQQNLVASESGDDESHNFGENCGSCHNVNGNEAVLEAGWWTISGSVSTTQGRAQKNAVVELWEKPNKQGSLIKRLEVDDLLPPTIKPFLWAQRLMEVAVIAVMELPQQN